MHAASSSKHRHFYDGTYCFGIQGDQLATACTGTRPSHSKFLTLTPSKQHYLPMATIALRPGPPDTPRDPISAPRTVHQAAHRKGVPCPWGGAPWSLTPFPLPIHSPFKFHLCHSEPLILPHSHLNQVPGPGGGRRPGVPRRGVVARPPRAVRGAAVAQRTTRSRGVPLEGRNVSGGVYGSGVYGKGCV